MAYLTRLYIVDVKIKDESRTVVKRQLRSHKRVSSNSLRFFLEWAAIDREGWLCFKPDEDEDDGYVPDEDGLVPARTNKWYDADAIAAWLKQYCEGGRIVLHSMEADGGAFGWEFDGKGRARELSLRPCAKWE